MYIVMYLSSISLYSYRYDSCCVAVMVNDEPVTLEIFYTPGIYVMLI